MFREIVTFKNKTTSSCQVQLLMQGKLLWIFSVDFKATGQLLIM